MLANESFGRMLYSPREAAEFLGVTEGWTCELIEHGHLPARMLPLAGVTGWDRVRILHEDLEEFARSLKRIESSQRLELQTLRASQEEALEASPLDAKPMR